MNLNDEVLCGYLVTAKQKRINAVYLDLLAEFDRLCQAAGVTWWMYAGNLIGAVRHKGFVPWDDDIDIMIPRADFERLAAMTNEQFGAREPYFLQNPVTDPAYVEVLLRFRRSDTTFIPPWNWRETAARPDGCPYNMGLNLSIFPIDSVPKSELMFRLQSAAVGALNSMMYRAYAPGKEHPVRRAVGRCFAAVLGRQGFSRFVSLPYRVIRKNRSGKVQIFGGRYSMCTVYDEADFAETLLVPFEDLTVPIPAGYDGILRATYGDYWTLPPVEKRQAPHDGIMDPDTPYEQTVRQLRTGERPLPEGWTL